MVDYDFFFGTFLFLKEKSMFLGYTKVNKKTTSYKELYRAVQPTADSIELRQTAKKKPIRRLDFVPGMKKIATK